MENKRIIASLLIMMSLTASAQRLIAEKPTLDCGKTGYQIPVTATFELKNKGSRRIVIDDVKGDCGCTKTELSKRELNAGEKCTLKLTYDGRMLGHYVKSAMISYHLRHSSSQQEKPTYVTMKGVVLPEVKDYSGVYPYSMGELLVDKNVLEFDDVNKGDHPEQEIHVLNNSTTMMTPNVEHLPPYLSAIVVPEQLKPGAAGKVTLTLNSQKVQNFGLVQTSVYLASHLGEKVHPDNELPVSVVLLPDLKTFEGKNKQYAPKMELSSKTIELGNLNGKIKKKGEIVITNKGRTSLDISSIQMFTKGLKLTLNKKELKPGEQAKMKIVGDCDYLRKSRTKPRILMITNDPDQSKVVININVK